jgi:hypothetical protein
MTVIHANDPTTKVLSYLYETRKDVSALINESSTNTDVQNAIRRDSVIMMLGHGNEYGLFSKPSRNGKYNRFLITDRHVQFLRGKTCIGIWCHANRFAEKYGLHGLFSGMIISEMQEAKDLNIQTTQEEISIEMEKFAIRLQDCIGKYGLQDTPFKMRELDDVKSELTTFNYSRLYFLNNDLK